MEMDPTSMFPGQTQATPGAAASANAGGKAGASKDDDEPTLLEQIREKGFMAYVEEIHEKKMEELRARILEGMGLSEEELAELPAEQRNAIEDMIARKMRQYMSTESAMNGGNGPLRGLDGDLPGMAPSDSADAEPEAGNGLVTGMVILQAIDHADSNPFNRNGSDGTDT